MGHGISWLADRWDDFHLTFARGIAPQELGRRLGADPTDVLPAGTARDAYQCVDTERGRWRVARLGECDGWSFAIEYGYWSRAWSHTTHVAEAGAEVVHLNPKPDDPPAEFSYARDGRYICGYSICEEDDRDGEEPDLLVESLRKAGVPLVGYPTGDDEVEDDVDELTRRSLVAIESHFRLSLPPHLVSEAPLPMIVTSRTEPSFQH
ncbi:DUF6461 domain-containing protein [Streptomyces sp. NPDC057499]|uniref:DUF6461 domain-containing protein n=1 Tax=Streptomyces sp. NPDC057499 TaxID=3346150 RepID=UPI003679AE90